MKTKKIMTLWLMIISLVAVLSSCKKDEMPVPDQKVRAELVTVTTNSIIVRGFMPVDVKICGVCWDTIGFPTVSSNHVAGEPATGSGTFSASINDLEINQKYYIKIYSANKNGGYDYSDLLIVETLTNEVQVKTLSASEVGLYQAKLNGEIKLSQGNSATYWFEYGENSQYGNKTPEQTITGTGNGFQMINAEITNLKWHQVYSFRLMIKTQQIISGGNLYFRTIGDAPSLSNVQINNNELDKLIVKVTVNPNHITTNVVVDWGKTDSYGNSIATVPTVVNGETEVSVEIPVERMTEYHFRFRANNAIGTTYSQDTMTMSLALIDREGNKFHACKIGQQYWLTSNWKTLSYNNGDPIPNVTDPISWGEQTSGALCFYNNDPVNYETYGSLYNWYIVTDPRGICPDGWHVPSEEEWHTLCQVIQHSGPLKEAGLEHWFPLNNGGTNATGFTALPSGSRRSNEEKIIFSGINEQVYFWTSTSYPIPFIAANVLLYGTSQLILEGGLEKTSGASIRLIKD